jgi:hypothetical protein
VAKGAGEGGRATKRRSTRARLLTGWALALPLALGTGVLPYAPSPAGASVLPSATIVSAPRAVTNGTTFTFTVAVSVGGLGGLLVTPSGKVVVDETIPTSEGPSPTPLSFRLPQGCLLTVVPCGVRITQSLSGFESGDHIFIQASWAGDAFAGPSISAPAVVTVG